MQAQCATSAGDELDTCQRPESCDGLASMRWWCTFLSGLSATHQASSGICTLGSGGCGEAPFDGAPLDATCLFGEIGNLSGFGDLGFCGEL